MTERARSQDIAEDVTQLHHRVGEAAPSSHAPSLSPGSGSWMFNSIEARARHGLSPTHVPTHTTKQGLETYSRSFMILQCNVDVLLQR